MSFADRLSPVVTSAKWLCSHPQVYVLSVAAVAFAALIRYALDATLGFTQPFALFYPVIVLLALLGGFGPGVFATLLSAACASYFFMEPLNSFAIRNPRDMVGVGLFALMGVVISVTGDLFRQRAQRLHEFEKTVDGLEEMIAVVDRDYRYVIANRAFLSYRGMKPEDLIGRSVEEAFPSDIFETVVKKKLDESFGGKIVHYEMRYIYPSLGARELSISYFPIDGPRGIDRIACVLQDVTDRNQAEQSLKLFRTLIDHSNDAVEVIDPETLQFLDVNQKACEDLGYAREELLSMTVFDIDPEVDEPRRVKVLDELQDSGFVVQQTVHRRKGGSTFPVETSMKYVELDRNYIIAVSRDISERKRAEDILRSSEQRYRLLFEKNLAGVAISRFDGQILDCNDAWAQILGCTGADEVRGHPTTDFYFNPADREPLLAELRLKGSFLSRDMKLRRKDGDPVWVLFNIVLLPAPDGTQLVQNTLIDISKHKQAEAALQRSEDAYRKFVAQSSEGIFRQELDAPLPISLAEDEMVHHILHDSYMGECNDALAKMYGFASGGDLEGKRLAELLVADDPHNIELTREYIRSGFRVLERESHEIDLQGNPKVIRNSMIGMVEDGKLARTWGIQRDVTEQATLEQARRKAEQALQASETHFRLLVEQASDGIFIADSHGRYLDVNSAGAEMLGYTREEILGFSIPDIIAEEEIPRLAPALAQFAGGNVVLTEWKFRRKDGSFFPGEVCGKQLPNGHVQGIVRDITERRQAEEDMRRSEERFRVALKDSPITVFNQDCDLRYTWMYNPQLYWQHDVLGKTDEEILGIRRAKALNDLKTRVLTTGGPAREEVAIPYDGKNYAFDMTIEPLFNAEGKVVGITGACMDIAQLREIADRLKDAKEKLAQEKTYLESEIQSELGFEEIVGQSPSLRTVLRKARVVAPTDSTVLVLGETGTGKELVARSVHSLSSRHDRTFVKLNCAAVPSGLLESELFGHEKGAFTSAVSQKVGRIELADKGTLFLDEIGELPLELQPKLLRVLQDREFERLGGIRTLKVDVRIIAATNRDLRHDIAERKFREDLFYRLNVFPISLPPLRDRQDDIPMLVHHFVQKHAMRMGRTIDIVPDETMQVLRNWNWPGNVRELENMIERMVILSKGPVLAAPPAELQRLEDSLEDNLSEMEREHIIRILKETNGVLSGKDGAANRLGIKRTTLQSMLKRFGIESHAFRRSLNMLGGA
jgi:formate hydrogenlyase transcriptional activator